MSQFDYSEVLTIGSNGMLGSYIDFGLRTTRKELDILNQSAVMEYFKTHRPKVVIHLAAVTDTNLCEEDVLYAYNVNSVGTLNVALAAQAIDAKVVYVSTSRVFNGEKKDPYTEEDIPEPGTHYGKSKLLGEKIVSLIVPKNTIVRGCWMFGGGPLRDNKFYGKIIKQLENEEIVALEDVIGSPTYAKDFIESIKQLIAENKQGTYHVSNAGFASRADIVQHILKYTNSKTRLKKDTRDYFESGNKLPTNESISSYEVKLRPWTEALDEYLLTEWSLPSN